MMVCESSEVDDGITEGEVSVLGFDCTAEPPVTPVSPPPTSPQRDAFALMQRGRI